MTVDAHDGGTDSWSLGGSAALKHYAPEVSDSFGLLVSIRPSGVHDEVLESPAVTAFADQFRTDVAAVDDTLRAGLGRATGERQFHVVQMVWIGDVAPRLRGALDALFGPSAWPSPRRHPVAEPWAVLEAFMQSVARLPALDPTLTELVRLRGARQHDCQICKSRRSVAAIEAGADETTFSAIDDHATSDLPDRTKAALALVDAMIWTPDALPQEVIGSVRAHLSEAEAVEVVVDVIRNAANKIAVALGADAAEVSEGVQLFVTDADGELSTV
jgi:alkylhydroperoxidase family enzyme